MHFLAQGSEITAKNAWEFRVFKGFLCIWCFALRNFAEKMHRKFPKPCFACAFAKSGAGTPRKKAPLFGYISVSNRLGPLTKGACKYKIKGHR